MRFSGLQNENITFRNLLFYILVLCFFSDVSLYMLVYVCSHLIQISLSPFRNFAIWLYLSPEALESVMCEVIKIRLKGGMQREVK